MYNGSQGAQGFPYFQQQTFTGSAAPQNGQYFTTPTSAIPTYSPSRPADNPDVYQYDVKYTTPCVAPPVEKEKSASSSKTSTVSHVRYSTDSKGDIVSYDPRLNSEGKELYNFLLRFSESPPSLYLRVSGSHVESTTHYSDSISPLGSRSTNTTEQVGVAEDFDFFISLAQYITPSPTHWTVADSEPTYRGRAYKEISAPRMQEGRRKPGLSERRRAEAWSRERFEKGLPPWLVPHSEWRPKSWKCRAIPTQTNAHTPTSSSKSLEQWVHEYCASPKIVKEFTYHKVVYGWDLSVLKVAVRDAILAAGYDGHTRVTLVDRSSKIKIRAGNGLSWAATNPWPKLIMWATLTYPLVWLFKRFNREGGGKWTVCGGAYPLQIRYDVPIPPPGQQSVAVAQLMGSREGDWFAQWESTIQRAVCARLRTSAPLERPLEAPLARPLM